MKLGEIAAVVGVGLLGWSIFGPKEAKAASGSSSGEPHGTGEDCEMPDGLTSEQYRWLKEAWADEMDGRTFDAWICDPDRYGPLEDRLEVEYWGVAGSSPAFREAAMEARENGDSEGATFLDAVGGLLEQLEGEPIPDPTQPPVIPGLPDPRGGFGACTAPKGTAEQEAILQQLPEPYQCQARTMLATDPQWKTNMVTAALNAEGLGLTAIGALLRQLAGAPAAEPAEPTPVNPIPGLLGGGLGGIHINPNPGGGGGGGGGGWPGTTPDPECPNVPMQSTAIEGFLANVPQPYRCQARTFIADNPDAWPNMLAMLANSVRPFDPATADALLALAEYGQAHS